MNLIKSLLAWSTMNDTGLCWGLVEGSPLLFGRAIVEASLVFAPRNLFHPYSKYWGPFSPEIRVNLSPRAIFQAMLHQGEHITVMKDAGEQPCRKGSGVSDQWQAEYEPAVCPGSQKDQLHPGVP